MDDRPLFERPLDDILPAELRKRPHDHQLRQYSPEPVTRSEDDLRSIARLQRLLVMTFGAMLLTGAIGAALASGLGMAEAKAGVTVVVVASAVAISVLQLVAAVLILLLSARLFSGGVLVLVLLGGFVPCLSLVMLLVVNAQATAVLRANGIRVGFFGARWADVELVAPRR